MSKEGHSEPKKHHEPIRLGYRYNLHGKVWEVTAILEMANVIRLREVHGTNKFETTLADLRKRLRSGSANLVRGMSELVYAALREQSLSASDRLMYEYRLAYVKELSDLPPRSTVAHQKAAILQLHQLRVSEQLAAQKKTEKCPSYNSVCRWRALTAKSFGIPQSLAIPDHRKRPRASRLQPEVIGIIEEAISQFHRNSQRFNASDIYSVVHAKIEFINDERSFGEAPLPIPTLKTISRWIAASDPLGAIEQRLGTDYVRHIANYGGKLDIPDYPCALVFVDSHQLDLLVHDPDLDITYRPWLQVMYCAATGCVISWDFSEIPPSAEKSLRVLIRAIHEADGHAYRGCPTIIFGDNGCEFTNDALIHMTRTLGITHKFPPPRTPNSKSPVERFFRTLNYFIHKLPGTTHSNPIDRGDYDSHKNVVYTVDEAEQRFIEFLHMYHHRPHSRDKLSPHSKWTLACERQPPRLFQDEFARTLGTQMVRRSISKGRVNVDGIEWSSPALPELGMRLARREEKAVVSYDKSDLEFAWVRDPNDPMTIIRCDPCDPRYQTGLTMKMHQLIRSTAAKYEKESGNSQNIHKLKATLLLKAIEDADSLRKNKRRQTNRSRVEWKNAAKNSVHPSNLTDSSEPTAPTDNSADRDFDADWNEINRDLDIS